MGLVYAALVVNQYHSEFGKWYVGQTRQTLHERRLQHERRKVGTSHFMPNFALGSQDLEWYSIVEADTPTELLRLEREWVSILDSRVPAGLNRCAGGNGPTKLSISEETRGRMRASQKKRRTGKQWRKKRKEVRKDDKFSLSKLQTLTIADHLERYKVDRAGCWLWQGTMTEAGTPIFTSEGNYCSARQEFFKHFRPDEVTPKAIRLRCKKEHCVNPQHLMTAEEQLWFRIAEKSVVDEGHIRWHGRFGRNSGPIIDVGSTITPVRRLVFAKFHAITSHQYVYLLCSENDCIAIEHLTLEPGPKKRSRASKGKIR